MNASSETLASAIGARLKARRKMLGIRQEDLAALAGIAVHTLSNIESGKGNPSLNVLELLLDVLGLRVSIEASVPMAMQSAASTKSEMR